MQKIVPFKKDIIFKTNLYEIVSISLDHELNIDENLVKGKFVISGEYKMLEKSTNIGLCTSVLCKKITRVLLIFTKI